MVKYAMLAMTEKEGVDKGNSFPLILVDAFPSVVFVFLCFYLYVFLSFGSYKGVSLYCIAERLLPVTYRLYRRD